VVLQLIPCSAELRAPLLQAQPAGPPYFVVCATGAGSAPLGQPYKQWKDDGAFGLDGQGQPIKAGEMFAKFVLRMGIYFICSAPHLAKCGQLCQSLPRLLLW
jgi:hypothetical protein